MKPRTQVITPAIAYGKGFGDFDVPGSFGVGLPVVGIFITRSIAAFVQKSSLTMVAYSHRPQSGHLTCYLDRTYHLLPTCSWCTLVIRAGRVLRCAVPVFSNKRKSLFSPLARKGFYR